ncbi:MAG TPA: hypothetical protein VF857_07965, partial [Spirochaetota bacterium]
MRKFILYASGLMIVILVWLILTLIFTPEIVPWPRDVSKELFRILSRAAIWSDLAVTVQRTLVGSLAAFIVGSLIGILTGSFISLRRSFAIPVALVQGAPPLLWVIPMVLMLGSNGLAPVAVVFFVTLPLVIINVQIGMMSIHASQWDMFRIYANSRRLKFSELIIPSLRSPL